MVQGTASSVGKSVITAALCRIFRQDGWDVAPFKSQNMALNSFVTPDGAEIGRSQAVQAEAAGVEPTADMNPILLKPEAEDRSQIVVMGKPLSTMAARAYYSRREEFWPVITGSLERLRAEHEVVVIEGAGSPAEINLRAMDMVNMRVARHCGSPVLLVGDIDRGGVFAAIVGTLELLEPPEREMVKAFVINRFRGNLSLLTPGLSWLEDRTGIPVAGVIPYYRDIQIAEEDSVSLERRRSMRAETDYLLDVAVIALPHVSNFDDFDPLEQEEGVRLRFVERGDDLGDPDLIVLPGTKSTAADLTHLRTLGLAQEVTDQATDGTPVIGICGGFQMLGETILDPDHVEGQDLQVQGLGLLPVTTTFRSVKSTHQVRGTVVQGRGLLRGAAGLAVSGYEIHMGETRAQRGEAPIRIDERSRKPCREWDGYLSGDGNVLGTYVHGLFHNTDLRRRILQELARRKGVTLRLDTEVVSKEEHYDRLAALVRDSLDMSLIYDLVGLHRE